MPIAITAPEAVALPREHGHRADNMVALSGGLWSAAFAFREAGREYVVKFHERRDDLEKDRYAFRWARGALRTPRVVEIEDGARGPYGISERVAGGPLDDLDEIGLRRVLPSLFSAMDAMRDADLSGTRGYGLWHADGNGDHVSWRDTLVREEAPGERAEQREALARSGVGSREFDSCLERMHDLLPFCPETRHLVHNDLLYRNVFVDRGRVVLLDWGASIYGDFLYDVSVADLLVAVVPEEVGWHRHPERDRTPLRDERTCHPELRRAAPLLRARHRHQPHRVPGQSRGAGKRRLDRAANREAGGRTALR